MCGISGLIDQTLDNNSIRARLSVMSNLIEHRGPDDFGLWIHDKLNLGLSHRRLSIIDLSQNGKQPMTDNDGNWIVFNGEIYNYKEISKEIGLEKFKSASDTEVILWAYKKWGKDCLNRFRGMFAFALWDEKKQELFCARDHFGIKPFYYFTHKGKFYFASEIKALLPFIPEIKTNKEGLKDYLTFQLCLDGKTLFDGIEELKPAHYLTFSKEKFEATKYWEVYYEPNFSISENQLQEQLTELLMDSVKSHIVSDVPVGAYISGGYDSSSLGSIASKYNQKDFIGFTGKFSKSGELFDESRYASMVAQENNFELKTTDISSDDFIENISKVIYHLDHPVAGPGSFSQFMVSKLASQHRKVVLGGQGGDEIFGGYTRYLIAYFEQCINAAIEGTSKNGNFVVTYESIIPNLISLKNYKPLLKQFWREGLFESMDLRYFQLINRAPNLNKEINWNKLEPYSSKKTFSTIFNGDNFKKESYFDRMTHFDFKTLLPGLLHVEDRMSMAYGLESRVPLIDRKIVEFAAKIPADIKFKNGDMKHLFKKVVKPFLPQQVYDRKDKMGFPTPINDWFKNELKEFALDILGSRKARSREFINNNFAINQIENETKFGRNLWALISLEIWQNEFHDKANQFKKMIK